MLQPMEQEMARKNLCPTRANLASPEKRLYNKDIWHYDDGTMKSLCGSQVRRNTVNAFAVNCKKCQEILERQKLTKTALKKTTFMDNTQYCVCCGARHRLPTYVLHLEAAGQDVNLSLCPYCRKTLIDKVKEEANETGI